MTGLVVGMTGGTGLRTETLAIANNSLGRLHLTGATGQAQGVAGAITTNQLTVVWAAKRWLQNKHTISTHNSCRNIDNDSHTRQDAGPGAWTSESMKAWAIKTTNLENKYRQDQIDQCCTFHQQNRFISRQAKHQGRKGLSTLLKASIKRYSPSAQRKSNQSSRPAK